MADDTSDDDDLDRLVEASDTSWSDRLLSASAPSAASDATRAPRKSTRSRPAGRRLVLTGRAPTARARATGTLGRGRGTSVPRVPRNASFPTSLKQLVEDPANDELVMWDARKREVVILDRDAFSRRLLPKRAARAADAPRRGRRDSAAAPRPRRGIRRGATRPRRGSFSDESRRRRGRDVKIPWRRVAAAAT